MNIYDRYALLKDKSACFSCLSTGHMLNECENMIKCVQCDRFHHETLHSSQDNGSINTVCHMDPSEKPGSSCIFPIMRVKIGCGSHYANVLWDSCASICLITNQKAKKLGLTGTPSEISRTVVGGTQRIIDSRKYKITMVDLKGQRLVIEARSIDMISGEINGVD